jgi:hypothetical protein
MPTWTTKDGKRIDVTEMTDNHLRNTLAYMERRVEQLWDEFTAAETYPGQGEAACYAAECAADEALDRCSDAKYWVEVFKEEIKRRRVCRTSKTSSSSSRSAR